MRAALRLLAALLPLVAHAKPAAASRVLAAADRERLVSLEADLRGARELYLVAHDIDGDSHDWVAWVDPVLVMADGSTRDLLTLPWKSGRTGWGKLAPNANPEGGPLRVAGKAVRGLGAHAPAVLAFDLPAGAVGFRAKVALDDGGAIREGKATQASARFFVTTTPPDMTSLLLGDPVVPTELFAVPEGLEVTVWATTPDLYNPTNIDFDERGRLFVAEGVNYREKSWRRPEGDRIVVLEDTDGDGRADRSSTFVQEPFLVSPLGVAAIDGKVVVSQPPELLVYHDADRDGRFDPAKERREVLLSGFSGRNHDHSLHSVTVGPDGRWLLNFGNCGADLTSRDGKAFRFGSPYMTQAAAGKPSADGRVWIGGAALRMNADGTDIRVVGHNFRNSYEQAMSSLGDVFQSDNDDFPACRVTYLLEGANLGFASADGLRTWEADRRPGMPVDQATWRQEDPGVLPAGDIYGGGSPTGVVIYENGALGDRWRGLLLACEAGKNVVFGYFPKPDGAGFRLERFDFLTSNKERRWAGSDFLGGRATGETPTLFRPSDIAVGPDGALYVADWFDPGVGGHGTRDDRKAGTIYRIAPKGFKSVVPRIDLSTDEGQVLALRSPAVNVRGAGFARLKARGAAAVPLVTPLLSDPNPYVAARALWLLAELGEAGAARVRAELASADADRRRVAFRALRAAGLADLALARRLAADPSAALRREVAVFLRDVREPAAIEVITVLAKGFDGADRTYLEALGLACEGREDAAFSAIAREMGAAPLAWSPALAGIAWRLHPPQAVPAVRERLLSGKLGEAQVRLALTGLGFTDAESAVHAMVELVTRPDFAQRDLARWWLMNRKGNLWRRFDVDGLLKARGLYDPDKVVLTAAPLPPEPAGAKPLSSVEAIARLTGDVARGKARAAVCMACHKVAGAGVEYGPDLTSYGRNQSLATIILGISQPSAEVTHGYEGWRLVSKDGVEINGILLSNADPVIIKSMGGAVQTVPRARVRELRPLGRSLMMTPAQMGLDDQAVADLAAYLRSL